MSQGQSDPGRRRLPDAFANDILRHNEFKYEMVILHPSHFMLHNEEILVKKGDSEWKGYSHRGGNFLVDRDNVRLPPFNHGTAGVLNPLMAHFAAALRLRRFRRFEPDRVVTLDEHAKRILEASEELQRAILRKPETVGGPVSVAQKSRVSIAQDMKTPMKTICIRKMNQRALFATPSRGRSWTKTSGPTWNSASPATTTTS